MSDLIVQPPVRGPRFLQRQADFFVLKGDGNNCAGDLLAHHRIRECGRIAALRCARKLNWEIEESGRSGLRPSFFDMQTQLTAAVSPNLTSISW